LNVQGTPCASLIFGLEAGKVRSMAKRYRVKKKANFGLTILLVLIIIAGALIIGGSSYIKGMDKPLDSTSEEYITVTVPAGSTTTRIGQILEEQGIIADDSKFKIYSKIKKYDGTLKAGEYSLSPSMTLTEILDIIQSGAAKTTRFTIPEGLTIDQVTDILAEQNLINRDEFENLLLHGEFDYKFYNTLPAGDKRLEGYLFPETYEIFTTASESDILNKMLGQFDSVFIDEYYKRAEELGYSINEIITIASLIERETRVDSERPLVASVIYNRLDAGMALQIDATVQYALGEQKQFLTYDDLEIDSPYNTYKIPGLPPGPICSPGKASIEAALYPADSDYYYYVLKSADSIEHNFAETYDKFLV